MLETTVYLARSLAKEGDREAANRQVEIIEQASSKRFALAITALANDVFGSSGIKGVT